MNPFAKENVLGHGFLPIILKRHWPSVSLLANVTRPHGVRNLSPHVRHLILPPRLEMFRNEVVEVTPWKTNAQAMKISPFVDAQEKAFPAEWVLGYAKRRKSATSRLTPAREPRLTWTESMGERTARAAVETVTPASAETFMRVLLSPAQMILIASNAKGMNPFWGPGGICPDFLLARMSEMTRAPHVRAPADLSVNSAVSRSTHPSRIHIWQPE